MSAARADVLPTMPEPFIFHRLRAIRLRVARRRRRLRCFRAMLICAAAGLAGMATAAAEEPVRCMIDGVATAETFAPSAMKGRSGVFRCIDSANGAPVREFRYADGRLRLQIEWDGYGNATETEYFDNGAVSRRSRQVAFHGKPATDLEQYWDNGLLRLRGTYLADGSAQGLVQLFHEAGPIARETWYEAGKVQRRRMYDERGQLSLEQEYKPDGSVGSSSRRFQTP